MKWNSRRAKPELVQALHKRLLFLYVVNFFSSIIKEDHISTCFLELASVVELCIYFLLDLLHTLSDEKWHLSMFSLLDLSIIVFIIKIADILAHYVIKDVEVARTCIKGALQVFILIRAGRFLVRRRRLLLRIECMRDQLFDEAFNAFLIFLVLCFLFF